MADSASVEELRVKLAEVIENARSDPHGFGERLDKNPEKTLREYGFQGKALGEVSKEIHSFQGGQAPSAAKASPCDYTTCWISLCNHWGTYRTNS